MASLVKRKDMRNWLVKWWENGRQHLRSTGTDDRDLAERTLAEVKALLQGRRQEDRIRRLLEDAGKVKAPPVRFPVAKVWEEYERHAARPVTTATRKTKQVHVGAWVRWMAEEHAEVQSVHEVTPRLALAWFESTADRAGQTRNNALSALRSVWDALRIPLGLETNPWATVPRAAAAHIRREAMTLEQVRALFQAARKRPEAFWAAAVALGYHTGLRWGDVCTLDWAEVDAAKGEIRLVPNKTRKKGRALVFPIPGDVRPYLMGRERGARSRETTGPVWPAIARRYAEGDRRLYEELRALFEEAGITTRRGRQAGETGKRDVQVYGFHSLRHTYVTLLEDAGVDRDTIQTLVGHGSPVMTAHYSHSKAAGRKVAGKLPGLAEQRRGRR